MISAAIVTFNEAKKLKDCLFSIKDLADEIVIIDLGSTDNLDEVLKKFKQVKKVVHERVLYVEPVRQFSIEQCKGDWVLVLDPDERVSSGLGKKLRRFLRIHYLRLMQLIFQQKIYSLAGRLHIQIFGLIVI